MSVTSMRRDTDTPHTGASWITWLLVASGLGEQQKYLIFHHMESQVYLEDGLRRGTSLAPDVDPHHDTGR